jgi:metal-responsive CopG/Arc/MetJ family transcriptional regulator
MSFCVATKKEEKNMLKTHPIPVRLSETMIKRIDDAVEKSGIPNRSAVIKMALITNLESVEESRTGRKTSPVNVRLDAKTRHDLDMRCEALGIGFSSAVRLLVKTFLEHLEETDGKLQLPLKIQK